MRRRYPFRRYLLNVAAKNAFSYKNIYLKKNTLLRVIPTMTFQSLDAIVRSMLPWS